ncbi:MAG: sigma-70 family RNA polymerase sigma factor [Alteromonadaceae bacterium]|nr:sigma-70 family RNA polymerase sigma factor [Alteromonadaceae bacterium]
MSETCNEVLFRRYCNNGDNAALSALYDEHSNQLYYYLLVLSDPQTAADITQKSWLKVIESAHLYQQKGRFQAWLFTIGHRMLIDELRRTRRWDAETNPTSLPNSNQVDEHSSQPSCNFHALLKKLPFAQREAFSLQQEDFSLQDIAEITNTPVETVKTRLRYARNNMRKLWTQQS